MHVIKHKVLFYTMEIYTQGSSVKITMDNKDLFHQGSGNRFKAVVPGETGQWKQLIYKVWDHIRVKNCIVCQLKKKKKKGWPPKHNWCGLAVTLSFLTEEYDPSTVVAFPGFHEVPIKHINKSFSGNN